MHHTHSSKSIFMPLVHEMTPFATSLTSHPKTTLMFRCDKIRLNMADTPLECVGSTDLDLNTGDGMEISVHAG